MEDYKGLVTGIDPGPRRSAWVTIDGKDVVAHGYDECEKLAAEIKGGKFHGHTIGCEMVASYGMAVGEDTFETVYWIGYFDACSRDGGSKGFYKIYRKRDREFPSILMHLCKSNRAKDQNVRQAILDMYEPTGGGKVPQVGTSKQRGPLYGITTHNWSALAVAITCRDNLGNLT